MKRNNKAGGLSPLFMLISGLLLTVLVILVIGGRINKVLHPATQSDKSMDELIKAINDVANKSIDVDNQLVLLDLNKQTKFFVFTGEKVLTENRLGGYSMVRYIIAPEECKNENFCLCMCKDYELNEPEKAILAEWRKTYPENNMYPTYIYQIECKSQIECHAFKDASFQKNTDIEKIVSKKELERITYYVPHEFRNGFSFARPGKGNIVDIERAESEYIDIYVVQNDDDTIGLCFTPDCVKQI